MVPFSNARKELPARFTQKIVIINVNSSAGTKDPVSLADVGKSFPFVEMHKNYGRVDKVDALSLDWL